MAEPNLVIEKHSEHIAKQCPGCKRGIEQGQVVVLCVRCKAPHHENCWYDAGGCGKVGCRGVASARPTNVHSAIATAQRVKGATGETAAAEGEEKKSASGTIVTVIAILVIAWLVYYAIF